MDVMRGDVSGMCGCLANVVDDVEVRTCSAFIITANTHAAAVIPHGARRSNAALSGWMLLLLRGRCGCIIRCRNHIGAPHAVVSHMQTARLWPSSLSDCVCWLPLR